MPLLKEHDIAFFRITGYCIQPKAVEDDLIARCREHVWANIPESPDHPEEWPSGKHFSSYTNHDPWAQSGPLQELAKHESLVGVAKQLLGENLYPAKAGSILLRFPSRGEVYHPPTVGHLDNTCGHSFNTITLLDTVKPRGGGFTIWPGSHLMCHEYFKHHDVHKPLKNGVLPWVYGTGIEFTGEPGDVIYIHPWMIHTVGHNVNDTLRMVAQNGFFRLTLKEDYKTIPDDLWWFWDGMKAMERKMSNEGRTWTLSQPSGQ
ncbi:phytanoyl-CoA dioxygenase family protein [Candidatus Poribacteria bacterium]|nr:phytanoyl-CoA dioxygenase family protein [Candidatus Poribacteria bacterium]